MDLSNLSLNDKEKINELKSKDVLVNIKSKYILLKILSILTKDKSMNIIRYNKKIQERLNLNVNDYKEYSQIYSLIEIEIKPFPNKFGKFININKKDELYYHIYFNDDREETKKTEISSKYENV